MRVHSRNEKSTAPTRGLQCFKYILMDETPPMVLPIFGLDGQLQLAKKALWGSRLKTSTRFAPYRSTVFRRSESRYSLDCISMMRDTVRWNSLASVPSVYNSSGSHAADMISLTLWS